MLWEYAVLKKKNYVCLQTHSRLLLTVKFKSGVRWRHAGI